MTTTITSPSRFGFNQRLMFAVSASVMLGASWGAANAAPIAVPNYSFEEPALSDLADLVGGVEWTLDGWGGVFNPQDAQFPGSTGGDLPAPAHGQQTGYLGDFVNFATPSLTTASSLTSILGNRKYTFTIALGIRNDLSTDPTDTATLSFLANDVVIPESSTTFTTDTIAIPPGTFADFSTSFTLTIGSPLIGQNLTARISYTGARQLMVDNVRVDVEIIPEPTTALLLASTVPLFLRRRKR